MKKAAFILLLALSCTTLLSGCKAKHEKIDLSTIHTTAAPETTRETMAEPTIETEAPGTKESNSSSETTEAAKPAVKADISKYTSGKVTIEYPVVSNIGDSEKEKKINELLKSNATALVKDNDMDEASTTVNIKCKIISIGRKRMTATYTGSYEVENASYPVNVFYTNTVDLSKGTNLGFNDYSDAYTMAGYVLSGDCTFYNVSAELEKSLMEYKNTQTIDYYTELFNKADFGNSDTFPESFSYENQGVVYFSIPVPHALGDYAVIKFVTESK
ncbi:MAG: hypothetical protein KH366_25570 [Clostridiaceae bacterium]|nr:hypothetical protein [Clostridiaceae bacterium]